MPDFSQSFGYMLILVNPGIVFISFIYTSCVASSTKKSTLARPAPFIALKAFIAKYCIFSEISSEILAGIKVFESELLYLAS